jgi:predicted MFS family arabinose efflux permease
LPLPPFFALGAQIGDFTPAQSGMVFLVIGVAYSISSQVWGYIARKKDNVFFLIVFGFLTGMISIIIAGPWPGLPLSL